MRFDKHLMAAAAAMALSVSAHADLITFSPTGTAGGNIAGVQTFDWAPGNALSQGVNTTSGIVVDTEFTTYYQANLTAVQDSGGGNLFSNGASGYYFTAVAAFGEKVTGTLGTPATLAQFSFNPTAPNFFKIYAVPLLANNLTGAGFTGTEILSGSVIASGFSSNFGVTAGPPPICSGVGGVNDPANVNCLDRADVNDWGTVSTVGGSGGSKITVQVASALANYFPDLDVGTAFSFSFFNTNQNLPFQTVDPSRCMADATADCAITSLVGTINGAPIGLGGGSDVLFQADGNQTFTAKAVPEPGSLALAGLALIGAVVAFRRRRTVG